MINYTTNNKRKYKTVHKLTKCVNRVWTREKDIKMPVKISEGTIPTTVATLSPTRIPNDSENLSENVVLKSH